MSESIKIEIYRKKPVEEFTKKLTIPEEKAGLGSAAAASAALAASMLERAAARIRERVSEETERLIWLVRNTAILRDYLTKLIDEDVRCHGPLRRALKEDEPRAVEASRQAALSICLEIVNMMGQALALAEELLLLAAGDEIARAEIAAGADMALGASLAAGRYILAMSSLSPDDTYRYVMKRENELTMQEQRAVYERISGTAVQGNEKTQN